MTAIYILIAVGIATTAALTGLTVLASVINIQKGRTDV